MINTDEVEFKKRVRVSINKVVYERNLTNQTLAPFLNTTPTTLSNYRTMKNMPKTSFVSKFCSLFECNREWLITGKGRPFLDSGDDYPELLNKYFTAFKSHSRKIPEIRDPDSWAHIYNNITPPPIQRGPETLRNDGDITGEFVFIPQMAGALSAGGGLAPEDYVEMRVAFRQDWIARKGRPENMSLIKVKGDSMAPTLLPGDLVLVDHSRNGIASQGGIYAVSLAHEIMIKRLQPLPAGKILAISDNKQYTSFEIDQTDIHINGQVLWFAREIER